MPASASTWLSASRTTGQGSGTVQLAVAAQGCPPGSLRTTLSLQAVGSVPADARVAQLPAVSVAVVVNLAAPRGVLTPPSIQLQLPLGTQAFGQAVLSSTGNLALVWSASVVNAALQPWLQLCEAPPCLEAQGGMLPPNSQADIPLLLNSSAVPGSGLYSAEVRVISNDAFGGVVQQVRVAMLVTAVNILPSAPLLVTSGHDSGTRRMLLVNLLPLAVQVHVTAVDPIGEGPACSWLSVLRTQPKSSSEVAATGGLSLTLSPLGGIAHLHLAAQQRPPPCPVNDSQQLLLRVTAGSKQVDLRRITVALQYRAASSQAAASVSGATYSRTPLQEQAQLLPALYTSASVVTAGGHLPLVAVQTLDPMGVIPAAAREVAPKWLLQQGGDGGASVAAPPLRLSATALTAAGATFKGAVLRTGGAVLTVRMGGRLVGSGAAGAAPPLSVLVAQPECGTGQRITQNGLACECDEGWQRALVPAGAIVQEQQLRCEPCRPGSVREGFEVDMPLCVVCRSGTYATASGTRCIACPPRGVVCAGGQLALLPFLWCDTCPEPAAFASRSAALQAAYQRKQLQLSQAQLQRRLYDPLVPPLRRQAQAASPPQVLHVRVAATSLFADCQPQEACELMEVSNTTVVQCVEGNQGPLCGECQTGWAKPGADSLCVPCSDGGRDLAVSIVVIILVVFVIVFLTLQRAGDESEIAVGPVWRIVSGWAQLAVTLQGLSLRAESPTDAFVDTVGGVSKGFTPTSALAQCAFDLDFYQQLWATAAVPFAIVALFPLLGWAALQLKNRERRIKQAWKRCCGPTQDACCACCAQVQRLCCSHGCCALCGCQRLNRVKRNSVVPMLDSHQSDSLSHESRSLSDAPGTSMASHHSASSAAQSLSTLVPAMPPMKTAPDGVQAQVHLPAAMMTAPASLITNAAVAALAAQHRAQLQAASLPEPSSTKGATLANISSGLSLDGPADHSRTTTGNEPLHVVTSVPALARKTPPSGRLLLPPMPTRPSSTPKGAVAGSPASITQQDSIPLLGGGVPGADPIRFPNSTVQQRIEQLAAGDSLATSADTGSADSLSTWRGPHSPTAVRLQPPASIADAAEQQMAAAVPHSRSDSISSSSSSSGVNVHSNLSQVDGLVHALPAGPALPGPLMLPPQGGRTDGSAADTTATFDMSDDLIIRQEAHTTEGSAGIGGGTGVSCIMARALAAGDSLPEGTLLEQLRQVSTGTDGSDSLQEDEVSILVSTVVRINKLKPSLNSHAPGMPAQGGFASTASTDMGMPASESRMGRLLWAMTSSTLDSPHNKAMLSLNASLDSPSVTPAMQLPAPDFELREAADTPSGQVGCEASPRMAHMQSVVTSGSDDSQLQHQRVAPLAPFGTGSRTRPPRGGDARVMFPLGMRGGIALPRDTVDDDAPMGGAGGGSLSARRRVQLPPMGGFAGQGKSSRTAGGVLLPRSPLLPASAESISPGSGLGGGRGGFHVRPASPGVAPGGQVATHESDQFSARSATGGGFSLLLSLRARIKRKRKKRQAAESPISIQAYTLRAILVALNMVHFGTVEACLRVLDLQPFRILGFQLFRHNAAHGSFDVEFVAARTVAVLTLVIVGVGLPVFGAVFLSWNRHKMERVRFKHAAGFLYEGYRRGVPGVCCGGYWYWEVLMVTLRKVLLLIVAVTVSQPFLQSAIIVLILTVSLMLQVAAAPFLTQALNVLESGGLLCLAAIALLGLSQGDAKTNVAGLSPAAASALTVLCSLIFLLSAAAVASSVVWQRVNAIMSAARKRFGMPPPKASRGGCCATCRHGAWASMTGEQRSVVLAALVGFYAFDSDDSDDDLSSVDEGSVSGREDSATSLTSSTEYASLRASSQT